MLRLNETTGREINLVCLEEFGSRGLVKGSIHLWRRGLKWNALQFKILIMSNLRWSYSVSSQKYSSGVHGAHLKIISSCIVIFPAKKWHSVSQPSCFVLFCFSEEIIPEMITSKISHTRKQWPNVNYFFVNNCHRE